MPHELTYLKGIKNYKGVTVTKLIGKGYSLLGCYCETPDDVDELIAMAGESITAGIERGKTISVTNSNGAFQALNTESDKSYPSEGI